MDEQRMDLEDFEKELEENLKLFVQDDEQNEDLDELINMNFDSVSPNSCMLFEASRNNISPFVKKEGENQENLGFYPYNKLSSAQVNHHQQLNQQNFAFEMEKIDQEEEEEEEKFEAARLSTFAEYRPSKFKYGSRHPDCIVETSALSVVSPPDITFRLKILNEPLSAGSLSSAQLEAVTYACQRHEFMLADRRRAGFFIGDGPGVGKGRTVAGIIYENQLRGREKAIWISISNDLRFDCVRDLTDIDCNLPLIPAYKVPLTKSIDEVDEASMDRGVIFCTYSALISVASTTSSNAANFLYSSRIEQIVDWVGEDFDGALIFDECHKAKNLIASKTSKPTKTALAVQSLQEALPNSRVVYCSATGAYEPHHMAYMTRLGLWGVGTAFSDFNSFCRAVERRGVGGLEVVCMDMKLRGAYLARQLSFNGVTFEIKFVELNGEFELLYNDCVRLWKRMKRGFETAINLLGQQQTNTSSNSSNTKNANVWAIFWSYHQRFFKLLCIASKVETVAKLTKQMVNSGKCVIIGLQSTGESHLNELDESLDKITSTANGILLTLVEKFFPGLESDMLSSLSDGRNLKKLLDSRNTDKLIQIQSDLYHNIKQLSYRLPSNTLDLLIDKLGGTGNVAEMTGRRGRLVRDEQGLDGFSYKLRATPDVPAEYVNINERSSFMNGEKYVAIISEAASAGISLQADRRCENKRPRVHITLELPWSADKAVQQFGRSHRSNQTCAPRYVFVISSLAGEQRFASTVARRLETLGALTHGDRRSAETRDLSRFNFDNIYGKKALAYLIREIFKSRITVNMNNSNDTNEYIRNKCGEVYNFHAPSCFQVKQRTLNKKIGYDVRLDNEQMKRVRDLVFFEKAQKALISVGINRNFGMAGVFTHLNNSKTTTNTNTNTNKQSEKSHMSKFLNRLLGIKAYMQNAIFQLYTDIMEHLVGESKKAGTFDEGISDVGINGEKAEVVCEEKFYTDSRHSDEAYVSLLTIDLDRGLEYNEALRLIQQGGGDFYEQKTNNTSNNQKLIFLVRHISDGVHEIYRPNGGLCKRKIKEKTLKDNYQKVEKRAEAEQRWTSQYNCNMCIHMYKYGRCPKARTSLSTNVMMMMSETVTGVGAGNVRCKPGETTTEGGARVSAVYVGCKLGMRRRRMHLLSGAIFAAWRPLENVLSDSHIKIIRMCSVNGNKRVGVVIPNEAVATLRFALGGGRG